MSFQEAAEQYRFALKLGQKYYKSAIDRHEEPYPLALDELLEGKTTAGQVNIGVLDIPTELVIGTKSVGRTAAMAGNFMPLLPDNSEFGSKWIRLCESHLEEGIREPIKCYEYLGRFYVEEGNKRVSVLKSYNAPMVSSQIIRILPEKTEDEEIQAYYEFLDFYQLSHIYRMHFQHKGEYARFQQAMGFEPDHVWTEMERRSFNAGYLQFRTVLEKLNTQAVPISVSEAMLTWLTIYPFTKLREMTSTELSQTLSGIWKDLVNLRQQDPIEVSTEPVKKDQNLLSKILQAARTDHLNIAFVYAYDPETSAWTRAHVHGQESLQDTMGDKVTIRSYRVYDRDYDAAMEQAVADGAQVIFATTPQMILACRRVAVEHPELRVLNCSLSLPYAEIRSYYSRIYESKFIAGAVAGAMAEQDTIGYIANYPIVGVPADINAFALGARFSNPRARIRLLWSCVDHDPLQILSDEGIRVISNKDATNPKYPHWALDWGTYKLNDDGSLLPLAVPCWNWGPFYQKVVESILDGTWNSQEKQSSKAINYWWGMKSGVIDIQLSDAMPDGTRRLAELLKGQIISGTLNPFSGKIFDQDNVLRNDGNEPLTPEALIGMDWLCDNVDGRIPDYEELRPESRETVRILGIHRETLPSKEIDE